MKNLMGLGFEPHLSLSLFLWLQRSWAPFHRALQNSLLMEKMCETIFGLTDYGAGEQHESTQSSQIKLSRDVRAGPHVLSKRIPFSTHFTVSIVFVKFFGHQITAPTTALWGMAFPRAIYCTNCIAPFARHEWVTPWCFTNERQRSNYRHCAHFASAAQTAEGHGPSHCLHQKALSSTDKCVFLTSFWISVVDCLWVWSLCTYVFLQH